MHGESHLTFTMGWIRVLKVSLKSRSPRLSPAATAHGQGRPFATKLAMMSESIKENERMKVMMAFQKKKKKEYLPRPLSILRFKRSHFLHIIRWLMSSASIWFSLLWSENMLAFCKNQRITQDSFYPSLNILNGWQTIFTSLHSLHPLTHTWSTLIFVKIGV